MIPNSRRAWGVLAAAWLLMTFEAAYLIAPASVLPLVMEDLSVGPSAASWAVSGFLVVQLGLTIPFGTAVDRWNNHGIVAVCAAVLLGAGLFTWYASESMGYWAVIASRVVGGAAGVGIVVTGTRIVGQTFSGDTEATAVAIFITGEPAGFALGQLSGPFVASRYGWGAIFPVLGALSVLSVGLLYAFGRGLDTTTVGGSAYSWADFEAVVRDRQVWAISSMAFFAYSLFLFFNSWLPTYLVDVFGMSLERSGLYLAVFTLAGIASRGGGGYLSDRFFDRERRPVVLVSFVCMVPVTLLVIVSTDAVVVLLLLIVAGVTVQLSMGLYFTYVREVVAAHVGGTAVGVLLTTIVFGAFTSPIIAGTLVEATQTYLPAFLYALALAVVGAVVAWYAPEPARSG